MLDPRLNYVIAVARAGSFTAATQMAGVTQSAITKSIADLEREIGYAIFYRSARGVVLTEKGSDFIERTGRLLDDARELLNPDREPKDPYAGVLRVGIGPASLEWYIVQPVLKLLKLHPSVRVDVAGSSFERVVQQLRNGALDIAVGFDAAYAAWTDLRRENIGMLKGSLFVRNGHPLLSQTHITLQNLSQYEFVSPSDSRPYGQIFHGLFQDYGIDWRSKLHIVDYFPTVKGIVAQSDTIGVVDASYARRTPFLHHFTLLTAVDLIPESMLCAAVRAKWEAKPAARAFISILKQTAFLHER